MYSEIGSEFWLEKLQNTSNNKLPNWLSRFGETALTSSGRGAITLLLRQIIPKYKTVLLPSYICESVLLPFIEEGFNCYFYEINQDLSPNIDSVMSFKNIGVFLHMGYFGFQTNSNLLDVLKHFKKESTIVVEDITHTLFSTFSRFKDNDFYVGSIRKWFGLPSGGVLASSRRIINGPILRNYKFSKIRTDALFNKGKYIKLEDSSLKNKFLNQFFEAETLIDNDVGAYCIDSFSESLITLLDVDELLKKRKENFNKLSKELINVDYLEHLFFDLNEQVCPMFYPILINNRDQVRNQLAKEKVYCPVHWPIPNQLLKRDFSSALDIYDTILSIPCDQRYGMTEMNKIISILKSM
ncbi:DegT/DnrJ/EryC1/StrS family aminotransferase [Priestia iocasae]|uniref:Perosamine synthetase n=1 Tax=Priestia iocasae TaxID=2291674 RepID=A0ABS2QS95_9BACI|nr:DegT/DnrJ/EryC1/StrS family aminotransferase [Metabacillus iocasae]MBM7702309.1 hypothetical protein [Metabacillus iocasae]